MSSCACWPTCRVRTTCLRGFLAVLCVGVWMEIAVAQDEPPTTLPPVGNSEFFGVTSSSRITRRFEIYDPHSPDELAAVKAMGFDQVILDRAPLHTDATKLGLDVVIANWWTDQTEPDVIERSLDLSKEVEPGRLAGISVMDEPERNSPETPFSFYVDLYQELKPKLVDELQGIPLEISYWGPLVNWDQRYYEYFSYLYESADVMRIMPYPDLFDDPLGDVYLMLQRSKKAMRLAQVDIPHVVILQTWVLPPKNKLPEIDELRVMAYQAMLGGAETVSFFEYKPDLWSQTPGFEDGFAELMKELRALSARLSEAQIDSVLHENGILSARATWPSGGIASLRVNTNRFAQDGLAALEIEDSSRVDLFAFQSHESTADVTFGNCDCVASDREATVDPFGPNGRKRCAAPMVAKRRLLRLFRK